MKRNKKEDDQCFNYSGSSFGQKPGQGGDSVHKLTDNLIRRYKILNEKQIEKLDKHFNSPNFVRTRKDYTEVARKLGIPVKKVVEYVELRVGQRASILDDFYKNAQAALKTIQLDNEYAMIKYKRIDKYFKDRMVQTDHSNSSENSKKG